MLANDFYSTAPVLTHRQTSTLSPRELEVLALVAGGKTNQEIGAALGCSPETVQTYLLRLRRKLGARNRWHAVAQGFRTGALT